MGATRRTAHSQYDLRHVLTGIERKKLIDEARERQNAKETNNERSYKNNKQKSNNFFFLALELQRTQLDSHCAILRSAASALEGNR